MDRVKILILGKLPPPYMGPAIATEILLNSSLNDTYEISHLNTNAHESLHDLGKWSSAKALKNIHLYIKLVKILLNNKPSVILIPISQSFIGFAKDSFFIIISRIFNVSILLQLRGSNIINWLGKISLVEKKYVEWVLGMGGGAVVLGSNLTHLFEKYYSLDQIHVVPNGMNIKVNHKKTAQGVVRVLYLANLQASKGIEDVVDAVKILRDEGVSGFVLNVVGSWRDEWTKKSCIKKTNEHELPIIFNGPRYGDDKFEFFASSDIFVFTPREPEGHPWVIVEALASGLPIISTDQGAIIESVLDGINGYIVSNNSPGQIAVRMRELIEDEEKRTRMGRAARSHYESRFTEEMMVERMSAAFQAVMSRKP